MNKKWIFSKVNEEGIGRPTTNILDLLQRGAGKRECSCTTGTQGMASNFIGREDGTNSVNEPRTCSCTTGMQGMASNFVGREDGMNSVNEPRTSRNTPVLVKPKFREMGKVLIARGEIDFEKVHGVDARCAFFEDNG